MTDDHCHGVQPLPGFNVYLIVFINTRAHLNNSLRVHDRVMQSQKMLTYYPNAPLFHLC